MLFHSIDFALFLPIVFVLYWFLLNKNLKAQNILILVASYVFYGWWDWRFLSLILFSTIIDYFVGINLKNATNKKARKALLLFSVIANLSFLGFFKYFNFFAQNFAEAFTLLGKPINVNRLNIILPVGISFYTFQTLSYSIDVYKRKLSPTNDFIAFAAFVSFFPQLVAGPIERAVNLLPQFYTKRTFDYTKAVDGLRQILWGFAKKMIIADSCARYVDDIFLNYNNYSGSTLLLGAILFAFQIYGDFSGYSDIAIGTSRLFGFSLMQNFAFPYFSRNIAEFWRRWHISLSTWFRDYVYIPLGGSRGNNLQRIRNTLIIFIVSGFWHGANWTFIIWGLLNAMYFLPLLLTNKNRKYTDTASKNKLPGLTDLFKIISTFLLSCFAWIFFRASDLEQAFTYVKNTVNSSLINKPEVFPVMLIIVIFIFLAIEWKGRQGKYALDNFLVQNNKYLRRSFYIVLALVIIINGGSNNEFIYFQF